VISLTGTASGTPKGDKRSQQTNNKGDEHPETVTLTRYGKKSSLLSESNQYQAARPETMPGNFRAAITRPYKDKANT